MLDKAKALQPELIRLRRDFHRHPELSFQETRTAKIVAETLQEIGDIDVKTGLGKTGVVGQMGNGNGPTIAIRADMDALPILEETGAEYASTSPGIMHACGHDAHTAMLLGAAHLLKDSFANEELQGNVRFIFQPSEEDSDADGLSGAPRMIEDGAIEGVDAIIALHVDSTRPVGNVTTKAEWFSASVDTFHAWITASGGHGAYPHFGTDPIWMLGPVLTALHGIVARRVDPLEPAVVSLGQVHAGTTSNVIPNEVYLHGTLRSYSPEVREQLLREVEQALSIVQPLGGDYRMEVVRGYPAGWNDPTVTKWLTTTATHLDPQLAVNIEPMGMGAEDFAYMCQKVPGAMLLLGAAVDDGVERGHHTNIFDIDEGVMPLGTATLAELAQRFLTGKLVLPAK